MDTELARTFLEIVSTGSFIRAAERLNVGQTTVSARIRTLEQQLGRPLFVRNKERSIPDGGRRAVSSLRTDVRAVVATCASSGCGTARPSCGADRRQRGELMATPSARLGPMDAPVASGYRPPRARRRAAGFDQSSRGRTDRRCDHVRAAASAWSESRSAHGRRARARDDQSRSSFLRRHEVRACGLGTGFRASPWRELSRSHTWPFCKSGPTWAQLYSFGRWLRLLQDARGTAPYGIRTAPSRAGNASIFVSGLCRPFRQRR